MAYRIELNGYVEAEHWDAINERNVYLSYTGDFVPHNMGHMHMTCEMLLVEEGTARYVVDGVPYELEPRSLFIVGSMDQHRRTLTGLPFIRYGLTLMPGYLESLPVVNEHLSVYRTQPPESYARISPLPEDAFEEIRDIFLALGDESSAARPDRSAMIQAHMMRLTITLSRLLDAGRQPLAGTLTYASMVEIRDYIDRCFAEPLNLGHLAERFFLSPATISRRFAASFGTSISSYIRSVRITAASRLLESSNDTVSDIGVRVGFHGTNTFIRQFREKLGVTPLQYRKQYEAHVHAREMRRVQR